MKKLITFLLFAWSSIALGASVYPLIYLSATNPLIPSFTQVTSQNCTVPCNAFFDATATTAPLLTTSPFDEIKYLWDFGDASAANWTNGTRAGQSNNTVTGPLAGHIYTNAGTFTPCLTVVYNANSSQLCGSNVVVVTAASQYPTTGTTCASPTADYTNCPTGARHVQSSNFDTIISGAIAASSRRVLFHSGETFSGGVMNARLDATGGIIGAYDTGAQPVIASSAVCNNGCSPICLQCTGAQHWTVTGINFDLTGVVKASCYLGNDKNFTKADLIFYANTCTGSSSATQNNGGVQIDGPLTDQPNLIAVVGNTFTSLTESIFMWANRYYEADNNFPGGGQTGVINNQSRWMGVTRGVQVSNSFSGVSNGCGVNCGGSAMTYRTHEKPATDPVAGNVYVAYNSSDAGTNTYPYSTFPCGSAHADCATDALITNLLIENNFFKCTTSGTAQCGVGIDLESPVNATIRNNILLLGGSATNTGVQVKKNGADNNTGSNVKVYNNSIYYSGTSNVSMVTVANTTGGIVQNNLAYANNSTTSTFPTSGGTSFTWSNNSTTSQVRSTSPLFTTQPPLVPADFKPTCTGSTYPCAQGTSLPVWSDYYLVAWPPTWSIGAVKQ